MNTTRPLSKWQLAWLAGFIDGEGTIGIYQVNGRPQLQLKVNNTCLTVIEFIHTLTGIGSVTYVDKAKQLNSKSVLPQKYWRVTSASEMRDIISKLLPYLLVKTDQAIMMLEFCDGKASGNFIHDASYYYEMTKRLNHTVKEVKVDA